MRLSLPLVASFALLGCPSLPGATGPQGEVGPQGPQGQQGVAGPRGDPGAPGMDGMMGPPGQVLVVDGGVLVGPAGASVLVTALDGGANCTNGGVLITQLSDGGRFFICTGATGATGPMGPTGAGGATGATGAAGPAGPAGAAGPAGPAGPAGSMGTTGATGATGASGPAGATGPAGPQGATGAQGPQGPQGPSGAVLSLDGGVVLLDNGRVEFAGFTSAQYTGNLGGYVGANQKCTAEFPGSHFCAGPEFDLSNTSAQPPANGAWIDVQTDSNGYRSLNACRFDSTNLAWTSVDVTVSATYRTGNVLRGPGPQPNYLCNVVRPISCCRSRAPVVFRGFTAATYTGNLGGYVGANQKCSAEFPGSHFCQGAEFDLSNTDAQPPANGAWIDVQTDSSGYRSLNACRFDSTNLAWTSVDVTVSATYRTGNVLRGPGAQPTYLCNVTRPLSCCSR